VAGIVLFSNLNCIAMGEGNLRPASNGQAERFTQTTPAVGFPASWNS
jgi:hypothetical protein